MKNTQCIIGNKTKVTQLKNIEKPLESLVLPLITENLLDYFPNSLNSRFHENDNFNGNLQTMLRGILFQLNL